MQRTPQRSCRARLIAVLALAASTLLTSVAATAQNGNATIPNNTPGFIRKAVDLGPANPSTLITVTVWLQLRNQQQLDRLVQQQYQPGSASFHQWLTQDQFNAGFAPTAQQLNAVQNFLAAKNLTVLHVAEDNQYIKVQGTIGQVQQAFHAQINNFKLNDKVFRSNTENPSVSAGIGLFVAGITGMDDLGFQPMIAQAAQADGTTFPLRAIGTNPSGVFFEGQCFRAPQTQTFTNAATSTTATYTGNRYGADITNTALGTLPPCGYAPGEVQTAYNLTPLYQAGLTGAGETVVITDAFGSATIRQDAEAFSQIYGLPDLTPENFQVLRAPGTVNNPHGPAGNWDLETTLDVEWVHAIAPGAKIVLVIGPTNHSDLDEAIHWAVIHHLGNTISNSWGSIEGFANPVVFDRVNRILQMAAAQGIDVNFSSGDCGDFQACVGFKTVSFPASSPFATGIGGTSLALNNDNTLNFETGWGNNLTRIANTLAQGSTPTVPPLHLGFQGGAGGGPSLIYAKPAFQSGLPGSVRQVPDIGWLADPFTGAEFIITSGGQLSVGVVGGTSLSCPMFSALMAIAAQKKGAPLGQAAQLVYTLPASAISDIVPVGSANNVTGSITDPSGTTSFTADQLAAPLGNTTTFFSAIYNSPFSTRWFVITFGTDSSLTTATGWDNVTGVGTPKGVDFVNGIAP